VATDDQQRLVTGTEATPAAFVVPGNGQIRPKTIFASYDGTGAAGSFVPAVKIISDGGETVGIFECDTTLAAGASADVTWFPHVGAAAASPPPAPSLVMPYASVSVGSYNWPVGDTFVVFGFGSVFTTDPTVFHDNTGTDLSTPILILKSGIYIAWGGIGPWDPAWGTQALLAGLGPDLGSWAGMGDTADNYGIVTAPLGGVSGASPALVTFTQAIFPTDPPGGGLVRMEVNQNSGATRNVSAAINIMRLTDNGAGI
jgi:hypothetical protein